MACDLRIAAGHARIGFLQGKLAISTAWGGGPDLFAALGISRALRLLARAEILSAPRALEWGLLDAVADDGQPFEAFVDAYVAGLRSDEHTFELHSLMRNSYDVFCLNKQITTQNSSLIYLSCHKA